VPVVEHRGNCHTRTDDGNRSSAQTIVTFNLKHFSSDVVKLYDIEALHPDEFLVNHFYLDDGLVIKKFSEQSAAVERTVEE
jgi:hypothetical protein